MNTNKLPATVTTDDAALVRDLAAYVAADAYFDGKEILK